MITLLTLAVSAVHSWTLGLAGAAVLTFSSLVAMLKRMGLPTIPTQFDNLQGYCVALGWSALTGTLAAGADVFQSIALVTPITLPAGKYFAGFQVNGTTTPHQTIPTLTYQNSTGSVAGTFGAAVPAITVPVTVTAGVGPFHQLS
jgi:hypothetical protein